MKSVLTLIQIVETGRSKRETVDTNKPSHEDMLLVQSIQISDKFGFEKQQRPNDDGVGGGDTVSMSADTSGFCVNAIGKLSSQ